MRKTGGKETICVVHVSRAVKSSLCPISGSECGDISAVDVTVLLIRTGTGGFDVAPTWRLSTRLRKCGLIGQLFAFFKQIPEYLNPR